MDRNQRFEERNICQIEATILDQTELGQPCLLTDLSERGARLEIDPKAHLSSRFRLLIPLTEDTSQDRLADLRWREGRFAGIRFAE